MLYILDTTDHTSHINTQCVCVLIVGGSVGDRRGSDTPLELESSILSSRVYVWMAGILGMITWQI